MTSNIIMPIPIITPVHSAGGGDLPLSVLGYIILGILLYTAWMFFWGNQYIEENWNGWLCAFFIALPWIIFAVSLII